MLKRLPDSALFNPEYVVVKDSAIDGKGVFATKNCEAGEALMIIAGESIDADECLRRETEEGNVYIFYNDDDRYIDVAKTETIRYLNHSCEPNAEVRARDGDSLYLVARRAIAAGEEITIDYGYDEIYALCFERNPACKKERCPARPRREADEAERKG